MLCILNVASQFSKLHLRSFQCIRVMSARRVGLDQSLRLGVLWILSSQHRGLHRCHSGSALRVRLQAALPQSEESLPALSVWLQKLPNLSLSFLLKKSCCLGGLGHSQGLTAAQGSLRRTTCEKGNRPGAWQEEQGRGGEDAGAHLGSRCCSRHLPGVNPFNLPETPMRWQAL